jgi:hypothetical protein
MLFEQVPTLSSPLNLTGNNAGVSPHDLGKTEHVLFGKHWAVTEDKIPHRNNWDASVSGEMVGFALAFRFRRWGLKIIDQDITFSVAFEHVLNLVPEIEPNLVDEIAFEGQADYRFFVIDPKANAVDLRSGDWFNDD